MHHHNRNRKLSRENDERRALLRSLAESVAKHGRITTTLAKAKSAQQYVERLITIGKPGTLAAQRLLIKRLGTAARAKLFLTLAKKAGTRAGGYTRVVKLAPRVSDGSPRAILEVVELNN